MESPIKLSHRSLRSTDFASSKSNTIVNNSWDLARLAAIASSVSDAIVSKTLAGEVTSWNEGAERIYGYREEEMIGRSVRFLIPPEGQDEEDTVLARIAANQRVPEYETVRLHKDEHAVTVLVSVSPIRDVSGAIIGALTIARDLSRYKEAEARIQEGKDQLGLALQAAKLGVWRWDVGKGEDRLHWDEACKTLFGLPSDAAVTYETWAAAIHPDDRTHVEAGVARANDPADPIDDYVCEYRVQHSDGTVHWIAANGRAFFEPDRLSPAERRVTFFSGTVRDVTAAREGDDIRRNQEKRDRFFLDLERRLQEASSAREAIGMACESLARELRAPYSSVAEAGADSEQ
jgi:PAS domain S-box-containing protein